MCTCLNLLIEDWADHPKQPDDGGGVEDCIEVRLDSDGKWFDVGCDSTEPSIVCEMGAISLTPPIIASEDIGDHGSECKQKMRITNVKTKEFSKYDFCFILV